MQILPSFDFGSYDEKTVIRTCVNYIREIHKDTDFTEFFDIPPIPDEGLTPSQIRKLEEETGCTLPPEYREVLQSYKYLCLDDSRMLFGGEHNGISYGSMWSSDTHESGRLWLVIGQYWVYADGDDLLMDPNTGAVYVYFHENGGKIEMFADDAKKALYRLTVET